MWSHHYTQRIFIFSTRFALRLVIVVINRLTPECFWILFNRAFAAITHTRTIAIRISVFFLFDVIFHRAAVTIESPTYISHPIIALLKLTKKTHWSPQKIVLGLRRAHFWHIRARAATNRTWERAYNKIVHIHFFFLIHTHIDFVIAREL